MKKLKILQICYSYPPSFSGYGKQLQTVNTALLSADSDIDITLLTAFDRDRHRSAFDREHSVAVDAVLHDSRSAYGERRSLLVFSLFLLFGKVSAFLNADVVHVVKADLEAVVSVLLAKLLRKRVVVKITHREADEERCKKSGYRRFIAFFIARADMVVATSGAIRNDLVSLGLGEERIVEIPNSVDTGRYNVLAEEERQRKRTKLTGLPGSVFTLLYAATISKRKGVDDLLDALDKLESGREIAVFMIGSDNGEIADFKQRVELLNARGNGISVRYLGFQQSALDYLHIADALVLPSHSEGMPNIVLESLSCGVPVIASDIEVHRKLVGERSGMTFRTGNAGDLGRKIALMAETCYDPAGIRAEVVNRYSVQSVAERYRELYRTLADK